MSCTWTAAPATASSAAIPTSRGGMPGLRAQSPRCQLDILHSSVDPALSIVLLVCRWGDVQSPHQGDVSAAPAVHCTVASSSLVWLVVQGCDAPFC